MALTAVAMCILPSTMNAQLSDLFNKVASAVTGSSSTTNTVTDIVGNLLGTSKITESSLKGTWSYTQPCVVFESESALSKVGGSVASAKVEEKLKTLLEKAGITAGKVTITFNADKTFAIKAGQKNITGTYTVSGSDLTLNFKSSNKSIKTNAKLSLGTLQLAMNADKMLEIVNIIATKASAYSTQAGTISTLLSQYKGMYIGLKFKKQ